MESHISNRERSIIWWNVLTFAEKIAICKDKQPITGREIEKVYTDYFNDRQGNLYNRWESYRELSNDNPLKTFDEWLQS